MHDAVVGGALDRLNGAPSKGDDGRTDKELTPELRQALPSPSTSSRSSPSTTMALSRAGTLSWQQRPSSRGSSSARSTPMSIAAVENNPARLPRGNPEATAEDDTEIPRSQIAQSLGAKDPSWFRQTADRGLVSPAHRRHQYQHDAIPDKASMGGSIRLAGLSRESTMEPEKKRDPPSGTIRSLSPSGESSERDGSGWSKRYSSNVSMSSTGGVLSPLPTSSTQKFEPPDSASSEAGEQSGLGRTFAMSPSQGRILPEKTERPPSPTKGLGGFVQSAMLKRSDSVNKRWSAQAGPGLSRGNSTASNISGYGGSSNGVPGKMGSISPPREGRSGGRSREGSPLASSRPGSSYSNATVIQGVQENEKLGSSDSYGRIFDTPSEDGFVKPAIPHHSRSQSVITVKENENEYARAPTTPPTSPSKTMDPKRWSPTKATWLESAINKPDSPKPKAPPPQQPTWMVEINKAKQQRGSVDLGKGAVFKEVSTGGLLRSPPLGGQPKPLSIGGLPSGFSSGLVQKNGLKDKSDQEALKKTSSVPVKLTSARLSPSPSPSVADESSSPAEALTAPEYKEHSKCVSTSQASGRDYQTPQQTAEASSSVVKPKPQTPPKKDFRSALKPRQVSGADKSKDEPEFKNVFGKLKRTQTSNYVAPDELKNNILRGKAGLTITGGPVKTERLDEFKESILKKKEQMKAGGPSTMARKTSDSNDPPTPEAISKKNALTRSENTPSNSSQPEFTTPEAIARQKSLREKPKPISPAKPFTATSRTQGKESSTNSKLADRFNPALAGLISRGPSPMAGLPALDTKEGLDRSKDPVASDKDLESGSQQGNLTHMTKARARGPKRRLPTSSKEVSKQTEGGQSPSSVSLPPSTAEIEGSKHSPSSSPASAMSSNRTLAELVNNDKKTANVNLPKPNTPPKKANIEMIAKSPVSPDVARSIAERMRSASPNTSTPPPLKSQLVTKEIKSHEGEKDSLSHSRPLPSPSKPHNAHQEPQRQKSSPTRDMKPAVDKEDIFIPVKSAAALWGQSTSRAPRDSQNPRLPIKLPTKEDEKTAMEDSGLRGLPTHKKAEPRGLGLQSVLIEDSSQQPLDRNLPSPPMQSPKTPPMPAKKPASIAGRNFSNGSATAKPSVKSPIPPTSGASNLFAEFFDEVPISNVKIDIDTHQILSSKPEESDKIKTLRKQIWEVTGDGKRLPIPSHQEHILFEDSMYLCVHIFGAASGARTTEIYLWAGDGVSDSAVQDALLFSRKAAKEHSGKLFMLKQGKETANFFQALGGIVITRRGSTSRADSSSLYMLCGRRHVGQIAFDEVDLSPQSLCSGFPYIISAKFGKLYLWKGKGSSADELGCARLIGMDLGLTGEIEEVDEGHEPSSFFDAFPSGVGGSLPRSADHWRLKPSFDKYYCRLFSIEHEMKPRSSSPFWGRRGSAPLEDPKTNAQIREIAPFCQTDLKIGGIYVLDAFFEIYM